MGEFVNTNHSNICTACMRARLWRVRRTWHRVEPGHGMQGQQHLCHGSCALGTEDVMDVACTGHPGL